MVRTAKGMALEIDPRRAIPAMGKLLALPRFARLEERYGRDLVRVQLELELESLRAGLASERGGVLDEAPRPHAGAPEGRRGERKAGDRRTETLPRSEDLARSVEARLELLVGRPLRRVLNATGIFLHTNLGRAPLPSDIARAFPDLLTAACDLELDLESNQRDDRNRRSDLLLRQLTGAEAALVVNNNAAALVLILATLARGRSVVVSRGELVEIGGSFRIPDILEAAGAHLVEVGTTNRTRARDYEQAIDDDTALLLKVHPSNYRIRGFTASASAEELVALGRRRGVPFAVDEGSGLLAPHPSSQLSDHRSLQELIGCGCDLVCGSGDKLLGGPQAGLIVGNEDLVSRCRKHPLYRAMRPSRATFIGLESVLRRKLGGAPMPIDNLWVKPEDLRRRLEGAATALGAEIVEADAFVGGGAAPEAPIAGLALALPEKERLLERLRMADPPVVGYVRDGLVRLDLRTVAPEDDETLIEVVSRTLAQTRLPAS